jgi:hypothetical protein
LIGLEGVHLLSQRVDVEGAYIQDHYSSAFPAIWAWIAKGNRVVDWNPAQHKLRVIYIKATGTYPEFSHLLRDNLKPQFV